MKTFLILFVISATAFAQEQKKPFGTSEILKFSLAKIRVTQGLEKNWKKCFGTEVPDLDNFLDVPTAIMTANAIKQLKDAPTESKTCVAALDPSYTFAAEAICLLDEKVAQELYELTEDEDALRYLTLLEKKTAEMKSNAPMKNDGALHAENAKDMLEFFRKFNKKKLASKKN